MPPSPDTCVVNTVYGSTDKPICVVPQPAQHQTAIKPSCTDCKDARILESSGPIKIIEAP